MRHLLLYLLSDRRFSRRSGYLRKKVWTRASIATTAMQWLGLRVKIQKCACRPLPLANGRRRGVPHCGLTQTGQHPVASLPWRHAARSRNDCSPDVCANRDEIEKLNQSSEQQPLHANADATFSRTRRNAPIRPRRAAGRDSGRSPADSLFLDKASCIVGSIVMADADSASGRTHGSRHYSYKDSVNQKRRNGFVARRWRKEGIWGHSEGKGMCASPEPACGHRGRAARSLKGRKGRRPFFLGRRRTELLKDTC